MSQVVEVMLITLVVLSMSILFVTWGMNTKETFSEAVERESQEQIEKMSTAFTIAYIEGDKLGIKNKEESTIYSSDLTFFLDNAKFVPSSFPYSIDFAKTGEFLFPTELKDYEVQVSGAYGKTDIFLPEKSFVKIRKEPKPDRFDVSQRTRVYIDLSGEYGAKRNRDYPVDVAMLVDVSGSMSYGCLKNISNPGPPTCVSNCNQCPIDCSNPSEDGPECRICSAKNAIGLFLDKLEVDNDKSGLVSFCSVATMNEALTHNHQTVKSETNSLEAGGGTDIYNAILIANGNSWRSNALKAEILLTDGKPSAENYGQIEAAARQAANSGIRIYTIGFMGGSASHFNETLLQEIARITKAKYYFAANSQVLDQIYDRILNEELLQMAGREIILEDLIPVGATYQSGSLESTNPGDCVFNNNPGPMLKNITCNMDDILVGEHYTVAFNLSFSNQGCNKPTDAYPDSRIKYMDYIDVEHVKILPNVTVNVTQGGTCT